MHNALRSSALEGGRTAELGEEENRRIMDRNDGLLIGGVALLAGALQQVEANAIDAARHDLGLRVRQRVRHGRRLARNTSLLVQLAIGGFLLFQGLRAAFRKLTADDTLPDITVVTDGESVA